MGPGNRLSRADIDEIETGSKSNQNETRVEARLVLSECFGTDPTNLNDRCWSCGKLSQGIKFVISFHYQYVGWSPGCSRS